MRKRTANSLVMAQSAANDESSISTGIDRTAARDQSLKGEGLLTYRDVARILQMSEVSVRRLAARGLIETIKIGSSARVRPVALSEFIQSRARPVYAAGGSR